MSAPVAPASSVPAATPVVVASIHNAIVASFEKELNLVYADLAKAWQTHNVVLISVLAFVAGILVKWVF